MSNQSNTVQLEPPFLSVKAAAALLESTPDSIYLYICNSGAQGGIPRKRFPKHLYVRIGRKVLFIRKNLIEWVMKGAQFEE